MILKGIYMLFWLALVPFFLGLVTLQWTKNEKADTASCMVVGYLGMLATFEILSLPMILLKLPFHILRYTASAIYVLVAVVALVKYHKRAGKILTSMVKNLGRQPWTIWVAVALILVQMGFYVFGMATDLDDSYYVANAAVTLKTDTMFQVSPYTGLYETTLELRYALSSFTIFVAFVSANCGFEAATMAHTVLPVFLVALAYMVYYRMGLFFFGTERKENPKTLQKTDSKVRSAGLFLCFLSLIHITSYYSVYTQGTFLLVRIWQGKAVLAAIILPWLFYMAYRLSAPKADEREWILLFISVIACCHVSSMGVVLAPVMLGIMAILFGITRKQWMYVGRCALCCLPCALIGCMYVLLMPGSQSLNLP